uniref:1-aminocyclopropane-1-carboxylate synthase-like protein 1 n=1 Tax=Myxine glutinosa TaxID=7769 RepID=UPI00358FB63D
MFGQNLEGHAEWEGESIKRQSGQGIHARKLRTADTMERSGSAGRGRDSPGRVLSRRGYRIMSRENILDDGINAYRADRYDSITNPSGIVNLGTSENKISVDMMAKRLAQPDMFHIDPVTLCYADWKGHYFLKKEMARFLTDYCRAPAPLDPENVVVVNGCGSLFTALSGVLCDDGDGILIPTPYYGVIDNDLQYYSGVRTVHVPLNSKVGAGETYPFQLTVPKLEAALASAQDKEIHVRGLILINPHNPLGDIYPADDLMSYLQFAKRHKLHVIMDEIYMLTIFKEGVEFTSVLSFDCSSIGQVLLGHTSDEQTEQVHDMANVSTQQRQKHHELSP